VNALSSTTPPHAPLPWGDRVGDAALYILCLGAFAAPAAAETATVLLLLAFLAAHPRARTLLHEPIVVLALAATCYGLLHTLVASMLAPQHAGLYWAGLARWLKLLLFIPFAFFSRGDERKLDVLLLLLLCGLLIRVLLRMDWPTLLTDPGQVLDLRPGFGLPALAFALYSGAGLIGLATVGRRLLDRRPAAPTRDPLPAVFWTLAACVLLLGLSLTASRSGWLALLAAAPFALWAARGNRAPARVRGRSRHWLKIAAGLTVALLVLLGSQRTFERAAWELAALTASVSGGEQNPLTSDRVRLNGLRFGVEAWLQHPVFGWGANATGNLLESGDQEGLRFHDSKALEHLHNTYLELLVQFGAVGLLLVAALLLLFAHRLRISCRTGHMSPGYCGFFLGILLLVLIWSLFDYRLPHRDWRVFWTIIAGSACGFLLNQLPGIAPLDTSTSATASTHSRATDAISRGMARVGISRWHVWGRSERD